MSMSSAHSSQRSAYRREDMASSDAPPVTAPPDDPMLRNSAGSGRSSGSRSKQQNPQQQLSTIEKSVTHLLVATKQLLETLTQWSRNTASETEVSDVYVRLGYEFNIACRAFNAIGVDTNDLGPVPDQLRGILEETLSQEASQASLDRFLPKIRDIIINLLHGLKKKQQRLRNARQAGKQDAPAGLPPRTGSVASTLSAETQLTQQLEEAPARAASSKSYPARQGSGDVAMPDLPPRTTSTQGRQSPRRTQNLSPQNSVHVSTSRDTMTSDSGSSISSNALQNIPVIAPYPESDTIPTNILSYDQREPPPPLHERQDSPSVDPPRPPPKQNDALSALQRGGELERRASRRFSAYQIGKHLGTSMNGMAAIPPAQHSPVPNRGRDVRESLSAVRSRGSVLHSRARSKNQGAGGYEASPNRLVEVRRISEEPNEQELPSTTIQPPSKPFAQSDLPESPIVKTPEDKLAHYPFPETPSSPDKFSATLNGPMQEPFYPETNTDDSSGPTLDRRKTPTPARNASRKAVIIEDSRTTTPPGSSSGQFVAEGSPQPGKELTLFLQYKTKIKKFVLSDGGDLGLARLQLAFIEKFAWNTQNNGADLPEIYIQDPVSGVRHELEDLSDVKERSVLVLNVEALDEVKRHFDEGIGGLRRVVEGIKTGMEEQGSALQRVQDRQAETAKNIASLAAAPAPTTTSTSNSGSFTAPLTLNTKSRSTHLTEISALRRDLAVVKQTYTTFVSDMQTSMSTIRTKASSIKTTAATSSMDPNSGRAYVDKGKTQLSISSEKIVNRVDDLQDLVEDLRKDVVSRGVRPLPRQLETVSKDISTATVEVKKLKEFLKREKPVWTKIWEKELQVVCDDRDLLTLQEELAVDLEDDLEKAAATFALVEQATKQQNLSKPPDATPGALGSRNSSRNLKPLALDPVADPQRAKDSVLGEVRALQPNHESRLEAIERAERARQRELEGRKGGEFQQELGSFVEGGKLKKTGGVEEVERVRLVREEKARRDMEETKRRRMVEKAEREALKARGEGGGGEEGRVGSTDGGVKVNGGPPELNGVPPERESSPEPGFVDAKEEVNTPSTESGPERGL